MNGDLIRSMRALMLGSVILAGLDRGAPSLQAQPVDATRGIVTKAVVREDPNGVNLISPTRWRPWKQGFVRDGKTFRCSIGPSGNGEAGAVQSIELDQERAEPIVASAWSRAEGVTGSADNGYALYLDITFRDGTHAWGRAAAFATGTHDWQRRQVVFVPDKPIERVAFYLLFRGHSGKVAFRDPRFQTVAAVGGATRFDGIAVMIRHRATTGFQVRDVAAESDFVAVDREALGLRIDATPTRRGNAAFFDVRISDTTGRDRAITLVYSMSVSSYGLKWWHDPVRSETVLPGKSYWNTSTFGVGANGHLSRYPLAAVADARRGVALGIDMMHPAFFRIGYNAACEELYVAFDIALTPEQPTAHVRFCRFEFDPEWGFRQALEDYYGMFPSYFRTRVQRQGLWMPFAKISQVRQWEDFGFRIKEGTNETAWDDAHDILTFHYTEPMTWWMPMPKDTPRTLDAAKRYALLLKDRGDPRAKVWWTSGFHDPQGRFVAQLRREAWCDGAVWSINSMPRIAGHPNDFESNWNAKVRSRFYGAERRGDVDGEYVDSAEGYATAELDFRRDHFPAAATPLCYDLSSQRPGIFRGLISFEYIHGIERDIRRMNKLMMANATPARLCWLAPMLDIMGTETDWLPDGTWRPMPVEELLYRRAMCRGKPFCFLMNTDFSRFDAHRVEAYMRRALAFGMFPGFFSHNASDDHYFSRPELYERDRALFRKYVPLCRIVAEAGWEPVTRAVSSDRRIIVERFGTRYLTVFNDSSEPRSTAIRLSGLTYDRCRDLVHQVDLPCRRGVLRISLEGGDVAVIDLRAE